MDISSEQADRRVCSSEERSVLEMEEEVVGGLWKASRAMRIAGALLRGKRKGPGTDP